MNFTKNEINEISDDLTIEDNIEGNPLYEWMDVVGLTQRPQNLDSSLYFATHMDGSDGWHNAFDRRPIAKNVARDKGWHLAVEPDIEVDNSQHLMVSSLTELAERLYESVREKNKPYVVGVTGSVGKTTTVAFLEHMLRESGHQVTRFWSKRLTPLLVQCHYINRVEEDTKFVVMEYSAYGNEHVSELAQLLPPNIAFLTNIYDTHINPDGFKNRKDIYDSKIGIRPKSSMGFINNTVLNDLGLSVPKGWHGFSIDEELSSHNPLLPPTLRTAELHTVGRKFAEEIGIPFDEFREAFSTFVPQERRIISCDYKGSNIFFDGDATYGSRQLSWFETIEKIEPTMLVESVNFGDEDLQGQMDLLEQLFGQEKTYVLDTQENRKSLPLKANFVDENKFADLLRKRKNGYLVYHKALSTRDSNFDPSEYLKSRW